VIPGETVARKDSTMTAHDNETLVRTMIDAFQRGDLATVGDAFAPDAVWDLPGRGVLAGQYVGPDAITGFLARSFELSCGTLKLDVLDVLASDGGAAHLQRVTAEKPGATLDCVETLVHQIEGGRIVRTYHRPDAHALDDFFGR
jgi:ketosteroid isomerase-like protein